MFTCNQIYEIFGLFLTFNKKAIQRTFVQLLYFSGLSKILKIYTSIFYHFLNSYLLAYELTALYSTDEKTRTRGVKHLAGIKRLKKPSHICAHIPQHFLVHSAVSLGKDSRKNISSAILWNWCYGVLIQCNPCLSDIIFVFSAVISFKVTNAWSLITLHFILNLLLQL